MSVQSLSGQSYQAHLQQALNAYSSYAKGIEEILEQMDTFKGIWSRNLTDLSISHINKAEKDQMVTKALTVYHKFIKTEEAVIKLFEILTTTHQFCNRTPLSEDTYETITNLTGSSLDLQEKEQALMRANRYIEFLAEKTNRLFKINIETRLPQVRKPLNQLIQTIHPELAGWWSSALNNALEKWLNDPANEQKHWKMDTSFPVASYEQNKEDDETTKGLDEAFKKLDLRYVDPHTKIGYGVKSSSASLPEAPKSLESSSRVESSALKAAPLLGNSSGSINISKIPSSAKEKEEEAPSGPSLGQNEKKEQSANGEKQPIVKIFGELRDNAVA